MTEDNLTTTYVQSWFKNRKKKTFGNKLRLGLVCFLWILNRFWIIIISLFTLQVAMFQEGLSFIWFDFVVFGFFGMKETKDCLPTQQEQLCNYLRRLRLHLLNGWRQKTCAFHLVIICGGSVPLLVWGLADVILPCCLLCFDRNSIVILLSFLWHSLC